MILAGDRQQKTNKRLLIAAVALILLAIGGYFYLVQYQKDPETSPSNTVSSQPTENMSDNRGNYVDYSADFIALNPGTKILFFHAPWCPQCRELDADIKANGVPENVTIAKVDFDSNQKLRQKYGVTLQTTLVKVDDDGNLLAKYIAYDSPTLAAVIANLL